MQKAPMTALILLNYNDPVSTLKAAERVRGFQKIDRVILVDNASTDDSVREFTGYDAELVVNKRNGGYGYGNNAGVKRAAELGCDIAIIANPDAVFTEDAVDIILTALSGADVAAAGALMKGKPASDSSWPLLSLRDEVLFACPILKRVFRNRVSYPKEFFRGLPKPVGAVHGSLFAVKTAEFLSAGGFDERFFLFCEEKVLGQRLQKLGKQVVLTHAVYDHTGSESMKHGGLSMVRRQKERQKSERLYYRQYLGATPLQMIGIRLLQLVVLAETRALALIKS